MKQEQYTIIQSKIISAAVNIYESCMSFMIFYNKIIYLIVYQIMVNSIIGLAKINPVNEHLMVDHSSYY
jgi:hypothetical protein